MILESYPVAQLLMVLVGYGSRVQSIALRVVEVNLV